MAIDQRNYDPALMAGAGTTVAGPATFNSTVDVATIDTLEVADVIPLNRLTAIYSTTAVTDTTMFICPGASNMTVTSIVCIFSVAAGGSLTAALTKDTGTTAPGAGTAIMSGSFDLNATANTQQAATLSGTPTLTAGDRIGINFTGSIGSLAGLIIQVNLLRSV